ncbi:MAG: DegV family protein [Oscillospiraceae bacterium]|jgi:DegV family protein with EDD domain
MERIAVLVDSGTDVPDQYIEQYHMYTLPLLINYADGEYQDKIDITAQEVYDRLETEVPTTSLPSMERIHQAFDEIIAAGYQKLIVVTISSGLSGTYNALRLVSQSYPQLDTFLLDTKNIGIGAGFLAIAAGECIQHGMPFEAIVAKLTEIVPQTKIFFCVKTLEYLKKGGRIGTVPYVFGTALNLRPIISCNADGVYYTARLVRGRTHPWHKALELAATFADQFASYHVAIADGGAPDVAEAVAKEIATAFPRAKCVFRGSVSPALVVHTGPGLIGIGVQKALEW